MNHELDGKCRFCDLPFSDVSEYLSHLQATHPEQYKGIFQRIETKVRPEPEYETMPYKDYIANLWAEYAPDDDYG